MPPRAPAGATSSGGPLPALLAPLADNGGGLQTHPPVTDPASWVVDQGDCLFAAHDQRGYVDPASGDLAAWSVFPPT